MFRKPIDPQVLGNISRRSILTTSMGLGALAAAELLGGGFKAIAATAGSAPDKGKLGTGHFPARAKRGSAVEVAIALTKVTPAAASRLMAAARRV